MSINLHIVRNSVLHDSRVLKETCSLQRSGLFESVHIAGFEDGDLPEEEDLGGRHLWRVALRTRSLPKDVLSQGIKYSEWTYRIIRRYGKQPLLVIHCNDLAPLPIAVRLKKLTGAKLIYDAHELETERLNHKGLRRLLMQVAERRCAPAVDAIITVSPSIQAWYQEHFPGTPVRLVRNVPLAPKNAFAAINLRSQLCIPKDALLFLYLGGHGRGRGIEVILRAFSSAGVHHHVLFVGDGALADTVRLAAARYPNIHWRAPVQPDAILPLAAGADVGLSLIEDVSLSYRYSLPNKLFEYWMAGIPVVVSPIPDQSKLVEEFGAGWIAELTQPSLVERLKALSHASLEDVRPGVARIKEITSWEREEEQLLATYREVMASQ